MLLAHAVRLGRSCAGVLLGVCGTGWRMNIQVTCTTGLLWRHSYISTAMVRIRLSPFKRLRWRAKGLRAARCCTMVRRLIQLRGSRPCTTPRRRPPDCPASSPPPKKKKKKKRKEKKKDNGPVRQGRVALHCRSSRGELQSRALATSDAGGPTLSPLQAATTAAWLALRFRPFSDVTPRIVASYRPPFVRRRQRLGVCDS